ncbi:hypothetical protein BGZ94_007363 [Podila epigama]|nr:hypothetical protein BGZ94_007363 [Podila epigama]
MNPYDNSGHAQSGAHPRHQQQASNGGYYNPSQQYNPNVYQQPSKPQQQQQQQQYNSGQFQQQARSPPPLQHPVPTRPPVQMRESNATPSPRMPYAQAHQAQGHGQAQGQSQGYNTYNQNQYQPQPAQQQQQYFGGVGNSSGFGSGTGTPQQQYPQGHMHQGQQQQPQQQQQNSGMPAFPFNLNDGTTQLGMQFGRSAVMAGQEYVEQNLWTRGHRRSETTQETIGYLSPRDDVNAPDLYIPVMAFVTYILLVGIAEGTKEKFSPELLGLTASSSFAVIVLEFVMVKLFVYLLNIDSEAPLLDLLAYSGYKFVGIIVSTIVQLAKAPRWIFWAVFFYSGAATGFFLLRSLRYVILPESTAGTVQAPQRKRRINFLICLSLLQFAFMWILI